MKESRLIEIEKKVERIDRVVPQLYKDMMKLGDLAIGTLETLKKIPGYEEALESLKTDISKKIKDKEINDLE